MIAALIADDERPLEEAIVATMARLEGAATVVGLAEGKLFAFRDSFGFRPLAIGRLGEDHVVASETCALDLVGATFEREVRPGELVIVDDGRGLHSIQAVEPENNGALCIFEFFYLARPDTRLAGVEVHGARVRMGERLAAESPVDADLVLPIPDSGTPAAIGFARATGIPFSEGLIKNRYVGRTFIQPEQGMREQGIRMKFNPLAEVAGKRLVVVDDSIVRGSTTRQIVADALRCRRCRGARSRLIAAGDLTLLLRDRSRVRGRDDRRALVRRRGASRDRRNEPRVHLARRAAGGDATARERAVPRLPHARVSDARAGRRGEAPVRAGLTTARARGRPSRSRGRSGRRPSSTS